MNKKILRLVECGMLIGLAVVLSMVKPIELPFGGSVTLCSMLPIMLISYRHGIKWGLGSGLCYAVVQILLDIGKIPSWGLSPIGIFGSIMLDYLFAFTFLGLAGVFGSNKMWKYIAGMVFAVVLRYICHVISGVIIFGQWAPANFANPFVYSLVYNSFVFVDLAFCLIAGIALYIPLKKYLVPTNK